MGSLPRSVPPLNLISICGPRARTMKMASDSYVQAAARFFSASVGGVEYTLGVGTVASKKYRGVLFTTQAIDFAERSKLDGG